MKKIEAGELVPGMVYIIRATSRSKEKRLKVLSATKGGQMKGYPNGTYIEGYAIDVNGNPNARKPFVFGCGVEIHIEE